jgi:glycosyltransferase involved in cell wall biosynthesis
VRLLFFDFDFPKLLADSRHPVGGAGVELRAWLEGFAALGCESAVLVSQEFAHQDLAAALPRGCTLIPTYSPTEGIRGLRFLTRRLPALRRGIRSFRPDLVVQSCAGLYTGVFAQLAREAGVPFVHRIASDVDADGRYWNKLPRYAARAYEYGLKRSRRILAQNRYQEQRLSERWGAEKVRRILNPMLFVSGPESATVYPPSRRDYVAWIGVFKPPKNMELLLSIARNLRDHRFRVAGMLPDAADSRTRETVNALSKEPNVELVGYLTRAEIAGFLEGAMALVNTSHFEGFSNTFLEAMAAGTPLVVPRRVDHDGIVEGNSLGAVVDDDDHFVDTLAGYLGSTESDAAAERCRAYVRKHHDPEKLARLFLDVVR